MENILDEVIEAMYNLLKKLRKEENGQSLVMVALLLVVLLSFSALVIDVGMLYVTKAQLQNAADAGALAGAAVPSSDTIVKAEEYARSNGVDDTVPGTTIIVDPDAIVASEPTTTTQKAYTNEELTEIRTELTTELNAKSDTDLIALAMKNLLTADLTLTNGRHTAEEVATKRTELTNTLTAKSDAELITLATANSLTSYLNAVNTNKYTDEEMKAKRAPLKQELMLKLMLK